MTCEVCGREGCRAAYFPGLFNETVTECLRLGYEREKATSNALAKQCNDMEAQREYNAQLVAERDAALAAARRECEGLRTKIAKALGCEPSASDDDMARGIGSLVVAVHDLNRKYRHLREDYAALAAPVKMDGASLMRVLRDGATVSTQPPTSLAAPADGDSE